MAFKTRKGYAKVYFVPTIANTSAPSQAELTAGTLLSTSSLETVTGFDSKTNFIQIPNFATRQTPKIAGETVASDSQMVFYEDDTTNPIRTVLAKDTNGYVLLSPFGATVATSKVDVFPVTIAASTRNYTSANEAAKYTVDFSVPGVPVQDAVMGS